MITVDQVILPLRLAAAVFLRPPLDEGTSPRISEMALVAIPPAILRCHLILPNGQILYPFVDVLHVVSDGIVLHGQSAQQRAMVRHIIGQSESVPSLGCALPTGQARPPEPGGKLAAFPFMPLCTSPAVPVPSAQFESSACCTTVVFSAASTSTPAEEARNRQAEGHSLHQRNGGVCPLFFHESRRYVCRVCTSHLKLV